MFYIDTFSRLEPTSYAVQRRQRANEDDATSSVHDPQYEARATETRNTGNDGGVVAFQPRCVTEYARLFRVLTASYRSRR